MQLLTTSIDFVKMAYVTRDAYVLYVIAMANGMRLIDKSDLRDVKQFTGHCRQIFNQLFLPPSDENNGFSSFPRYVQGLKQRLSLTNLLQTFIV